MYLLTEELKSLKQLMLAEQEETGDVDDSLDTYLAKLKDDLEFRVEGACKLSAVLDGMASIRAAEGRRLVESGQNLANQAKRLRERLKARLEECGERKVATDLFTVSVCKNGGKQPLEIREDDVPMVWKECFHKPDMDLIRLELERGKPLGFAQLQPRGTHLRIK